MAMAGGERQGIDGDDGSGVVEAGSGSGDPFPVRARVRRHGGGADQGGEQRG